MKKFTPTDEKQLALFAAYIALVRALQANKSLDPSDLIIQLEQVEHRYQIVGETGAALHLSELLIEIKRMKLCEPPSHSGDSRS
ncbi:hypothetical protein F3U23_17525 [Salmonella enterica]|nr:hypothetical protein [Salmonella enterica]